MPILETPKILLFKKKLADYDCSVRLNIAQEKRKIILLKIQSWQ